MLDEQDFISRVLRTCKTHPAMRDRLLELLQTGDNAPMDAPLALGAQQFSAEQVDLAYSDADAVIGG